VPETINLAKRREIQCRQETPLGISDTSENSAYPTKDNSHVLMIAYVNLFAEKRLLLWAVAGLRGVVIGKRPGSRSAPQPRAVLWGQHSGSLIRQPQASPNLAWQKTSQMFSGLWACELFKGPSRLAMNNWGSWHTHPWENAWLESLSVDDEEEIWLEELSSCMHHLWKQCSLTARPCSRLLQQATLPLPHCGK